MRPSEIAAGVGAVCLLLALLTWLLMRGIVTDVACARSCETDAAICSDERTSGS